MKLYFYFLETPYKRDSYIRFEECEVEEKPKTYKPVDKFPSGYYGCYVRKEDIGKLSGYSRDTVILAQNEPEVALKLFENTTNSIIKRHEEEIQTLKSKLKAIQEWRSENASKN